MNKNLMEFDSNSKDDKNKDLVELKSFLSLVNVYYERLLRGHTIYNLVSQLDTECAIFDYNKIAEEQDLIEHTGFVDKEEDKENNWYALSYAAYRFLDNNITNNETIDKYILKMTER